MKPSRVTCGFTNAHYSCIVLVESRFHNVCQADNAYHAALESLLIQSPTAKTIIPESKMYVGDDCSTLDERVVTEIQNVLLPTSIIFTISISGKALCKET